MAKKNPFVPANVKVSKCKIDFSGLTSLKRKLEALNGMAVQVGHFDGEIHPLVDARRPVSYAELGYFVINGDRRTPGRPYLPISLNVFAKEQKVQILSAFRIALRVKPQTTIRNLRRLGAVAARTTKKVMRSARSYGMEPNAPTTIALKGSAYPTIDSGLLRRNVSHRMAGKRDMRSPISKAFPSYVKYG